MNWKRLLKSIGTPPLFAGMFGVWLWGLASLLGAYPLVFFAMLLVALWAVCSMAVYHTWYRREKKWRP